LVIVLTIQIARTTELAHLIKRTKNFNVIVLKIGMIYIVRKLRSNWKKIKR